MFKRHYNTIAFGIALLFLIIGFSLYYVQLANVKSLIIVHFIARRGADFLGNKSDALGMLVSGTVITIINYILMAAFYNRNRLVAHLISIFTAFLALLILIAIIVIISVN